MIHECVDQYACLAANINFNLENLRNGFWQLTIDGLSWGAIYAMVAVGYTLEQWTYAFTNTFTEERIAPAKDDEQLIA